MTYRQEESNVSLDRLFEQGGTAMNATDATILQAAAAILRQIEKESRSAAFADRDGNGHYFARVECAAETAADMIGSFLIVCHVYGDDSTKQVATDALGEKMTP